jgi:hypothetical protein
MPGLFVSNGEGVEAKQKMGKAGSSFDLGVVAPSCSASSTDSFAIMPPPTTPVTPAIHNNLARTLQLLLIVQ